MSDFTVQIRDEDGQDAGRTTHMTTSDTARAVRDALTSLGLEEGSTITITVGRPRPREAFAPRHQHQHQPYAADDHSTFGRAASEDYIGPYGSGTPFLGGPGGH